MIYFISFLSAGLVAIALTPLSAMFARWLGIVDLPGVRKVHTEPVPRAGGLAIFLSMTVVGLPALVLLSRGHRFGYFSAELSAMWIAGAFLLAVGVVDDVFEISGKLKLLALLAAAAAFCAAGGGISSIQLNNHAPIALGYLALPMSVLWIIGVTVSINFIDGLDGLAGGIAAITCGVLALVTGLHGQVALCVVSLAMLGSLCGFLVFNWHPASVFMGDCGSMFAGFVIACLALLAGSRVGTVSGIVLPATALSIALIDGALTFLRRGVLHRRSIFSAERGHIHHRLLDSGLRHLQVVLLLLGLSLACACIGFAALLTQGWAKVGIWLLIVPLLIGAFKIAGSVHVQDTIRAIRRNRSLGNDARQARTAFEDVQLRFRLVTDFDGWWAELCQAGQNLGLFRLTLTLVNRDQSQRVLHWKNNELANSIETSPADFEERLMCVTIPIADRRAVAAPSLKAEILAGFSLEASGRRLALFTRLLGEHSLDTLYGKAAQVDRTQPGSTQSDPEETAPRNVLPAHVRVAVVHDFLYTYAGAEKVLEQILQLFPHADLFSLFDLLPGNQRQFILNKRVTTTFLQKMPFISRLHRLYLPLMPLAIEQLNLSKYDVIISSSYVAAKGVLTGPQQMHVCYCHSPVRFAWDMQNQYLSGVPGLKHVMRSFAARIVLHYIRNWDVTTANNVDAFIANSDFVGSRIQKFYRRDSTTIYPPVDVNQFTQCEERSSYYLTASRLVQYKRVDLIVEAFTRTPDRELVVIGEGPEFEKIRATAGPNVRMLGYQSFDRLKYYMQHARGFVFAAEEDFGIAPVEAQACGTPVIAYGRGGVTESVVPGRTGVLFPEQTVESLLNAIERFEKLDWSASVIRSNAERFSIKNFQDQMGNFLRETFNEVAACHKTFDAVESELQINDAAVTSLISFANRRIKSLSSEMGIGTVGSEISAQLKKEAENRAIKSARVG